MLIYLIAFYQVQKNAYAKAIQVKSRNKVEIEDVIDTDSKKIRRAFKILCQPDLNTEYDV